jgi:hypothetical protein
MKSLKIKIGFAKESDSSLAVIAAFIVTCLTNNVYFPALAGVADLAAAVTAFTKALEDAKSKSTESIAKKNQCRLVVLQLLKSLGLTIMGKANGDSEMLNSTGYPIAKAPGPRTIGNPGTVFLKPGISSGMIEASVKPEKPAPSYLFQIVGVDPESEERVEWSSYGSTVGKFVFTDLVPRKQYWIRVISIGPRGQRVAGPVFSAYAS